MSKAEKIQNQISYMLDDSNLTVKVSDFSGVVFLRSENKKSFNLGLTKLTEKMGLNVVYAFDDEGEFEAMLET